MQPDSSTFQMLHSGVGCLPYPQTLDKAEKTCQEPTLAYYEDS